MGGLNQPFLPVVLFSYMQQSDFEIHVNIVIDKKTIQEVK